ncbi:hypothetical protein EV363DRAFT_1325652 [Boletus edulis]|uniref:Uncharacterized protein n=1 Tax=Boletus edulis BED1 TaxID=1328754 RepID=A0AAD4G6A6_BOLED|nr:hypothetical protein EV363DRAFT_1325652 [Boletus edulis]KAF8419968.1 hypothetical protein L210DRAFT_3575981 [Boletus edulis BED1]
MASEEKVGCNDVTSLQARGQQLHPRSLFLTRRLDQPPLSLRPHSHHMGRRKSQTDSDGRLPVDIPVKAILVSYGSIPIRLSCPPIQSRNSMHPPGPEMSGVCPPLTLSQHVGEVYASTYLDTVQFSWPSRHYRAHRQPLHNPPNLKKLSNPMSEPNYLSWPPAASRRKGRLVGRTRWGWCLLGRRVAHRHVTSTSPSSIPSLQ